MRVALAKPGEIIACPCCGEQGKKHRQYAMRVECHAVYKAKKNAEWRLANPGYKSPKQNEVKTKTLCGWGESLSSRYLAMPMGAQA
jgi:hypothetical protein